VLSDLIERALAARSIDFARDRPTLLIPRGTTVGGFDTREGCLVDGVVTGKCVSASGAFIVNRGGLVVGNVTCSRFVLLGTLGQKGVLSSVDCDTVAILEGSTVTNTVITYRAIEYICPDGLVSDATLRRAASPLKLAA
jgi:cytoskeletal protein CcmA (bactofilin family)